MTNKKSIGTSPFNMVYGTEDIFPIQLSLPIANFLQEEEGEPNDLVIRILHLVERLH